jgi:hypothetical protein
MMSSMANKQIVPSKTEMRRYLRQGLTQQQIADAWQEDTGVKVSRAAIAMAIARYGLQSTNTRPRYEETLPWTIRTEHQNDHNARMLRLEGRRRRGFPLSEQEQRWLSGWKANLKARDAVVTYVPDLPAPDGPFVWVPRNQWDDDIVRVELDNRPEGQKGRKPATRKRAAG